MRSVIGMPQKLGDAVNAAPLSVTEPIEEAVTAATDTTGWLLARVSETQTPTMMRIRPTPAPTPTRKTSRRVGFFRPRALSASEDNPLLATTCASWSNPELGIASLLPPRLL